MKALSAQAWALWGLLADGQRHHVRDLASQLGCDIIQLNGCWHQLPENVQASLRQQDGWWQLKHAVAVLSPLQMPNLSEQTGFDCSVVTHTTSTNDDLWQRWHEGVDIHQHMAMALSQSAGRGRMGRTWHNALGQNLMFSVGCRLPIGVNNVAALPLVVGLAVREVLQRQHIQVQLKWPNDLMVGELKLGGILVESKIRGERWHAVMGIGLNVSKHAGEPLPDIATTCQAQQPCFDSALFLAQLLPLLDDYVERFLTQGLDVLQAAYHEAMQHIGQMVTVYERGDVLAQGQVLGVSEQGALQLQQASGHIQDYYSGEISVRLAHQERPETVANEASMKHNLSHSSQTTIVTAPKIMANMAYVLLDGGNSQLKWAWVDRSGALHFVGRAPYANLQALTQFIAEQAPNVRILGCAVCGAKKMAAVEHAVHGQHIEWLPSMRHALGITNHYYKVQQHGSDRWFNVLGSRLFSQKACVVVSCGTAITVDALTHDDHYLGGSIMPGFNLMKEAMAAKTANLHQPIGKAYPFATSTSNALASGMQDAASGAVVLMHHRLQQRQPGESVDIILTGGGAAKIEQHLPRALILDSEVQIVDNLVLFGLKNWVEHTCNY